MARGKREEFNPKRRVIRGHSNRNPFEENEDTDNPSRFYNPVVSRSEEEDKLDVAYLYNQYFLNAKGDY